MKISEDLFLIEHISELPVASAEVQSSGKSYMSADLLKVYELNETRIMEETGVVRSEWFWVIKERHHYE